MKNYSEIQEFMISNGHRSSKTRNKLIEIFIESEKPLSVPELLNDLKPFNPKINKTTVYREIQKLLNHDIIREVFIYSDKLSYELAHTDHHHHITCIQCKRVDDVPMESDVQTHEKRIQSTLQYQVLNHSLEFFGICKSCQ